MGEGRPREALDQRVEFGPRHILLIRVASGFSLGKIRRRFQP
jgi:hypothetical protein